MIGVIAVTGAAGFLGRVVVASLAARGARVRAISREGEDVAGAAEAVASGNLLNAEPAALVEGCHAVVNCAARVHVLRREAAEAAEESYRTMNIEFPLKLARAAKAAGTRRFVQLSSAAALASASKPGIIIDDATVPRPTSPYGRSKLAADEALAELSDQSFAIVSLRPPTIYGPGVGAWFALFDRAARVGLPLPIRLIENARSFAFCGNVADAVASAALDGPSGAFLVTDSAPLSTAALYRKLLALHGHGDRIWPMPRAWVWTTARVLLRGRAASLLGDAVFDGSQFADLFCWSPPTALDEALECTVGARQ